MAAPLYLNAAKLGETKEENGYVTQTLPFGVMLGSG